MPVVSQNQRAAMYAAKAGHSTLGIPQKVGAEFVAASHGVKHLPKRVAKPKAAPHRAPPMFGSLAPTQAGHYDGDMPE